jgi:4'-phosphopantetheinyl transferase
MEALVDILYSKCPSSLPSNLDLSFLSDAYIRQFHAYATLGDKLSYYYSKKILFDALNHRFGIQSLVNILQRQKGKPYIPLLPEFNISHSGEHIIVALMHMSEPCIGVDIQMHRPIDKALFRKYFIEKEWTEIVDDDKYFFDLWTIKEAAIKAEGSGMSILNDTCTIDAEVIRAQHKRLYYYNLNHWLKEGGVSASIASDYRLQISWHDITTEII